MSISVATLGMFTPATGSGGTTIIERVVETGSSGYGYAYTKKKPQVVVQSVLENGYKHKSGRPNVIVREVEL